MGYQVIHALGNLGGDAEVGDAGGTPVVNFSVACTKKYLKDNEPQERTEWLRCAAFGKRYSNLAKYLTKGKMIFLTGSLRTDKVGEGADAKFYTKVIVDNIEFAGGNKGSDETVDSDD